MKKPLYKEQIKYYDTVRYTNENWQEAKLRLETLRANKQWRTQCKSQKTN